MPNLIEATQRHALQSPNRQAVVFVSYDRDGSRTSSLTFAELVAAAQGVAAQLSVRCQPGDRAVMLYPSGLHFITAFLGCLYAGVVPVPVPLPGSGRSHQLRTTAVLRNCGATVVLTDSATRTEVDQWIDNEQLDTLDVLNTDTAEPALPENHRWLETDEDSLAFLQYTSGSTSEPKGVEVGHANLRHNLGLLADALGVTSDDTGCSWLPLFHDMGLIGAVLLPLFLGGRVVLISPRDFIRRPHRWLDLINTYRASYSFAPEFAYKLCSRTITDEQLAGWDLSCWRVAMNGAEPIRAQTMARFAQRMAPAGFHPTAMRPGYGLAEATLMVTASPAGREPKVFSVDPLLLADHVFQPAENGISIVSCGVPRDLTVRIVQSESNRVLPDGQVGEIWVAGGSVARGYWQSPQHTGQVFGLRTDTGEGSFLRTGDLGVFHDGELYVTGRIKDLMIINGRNVYPQDIEREVADLHPAFDGLHGSVFSVPSAPPEEEIVVVQELKRSRVPDEDFAQLSELTKHILSRSLGVPIVNVVFLAPGKIERTTSGKVQRSRMRTLFLSGELQSIHQDLGEGLRALAPLPAGSSL